jgi:uncharacterized YccA/Bax inhibitor family protein
VFLRLLGFEIVGLVVAFCRKGNQSILVLNGANVEAIFVAYVFISFVLLVAFLRDQFKYNLK